MATQPPTVEFMQRAIQHEIERVVSAAIKAETERVKQTVEAALCSEIGRIVLSLSKHFDMQQAGERVVITVHQTVGRASNDHR